MQTPQQHIQSQLASNNQIISNQQTQISSNSYQLVHQQPAGSVIFQQQQHGINVSQTSNGNHLIQNTPQQLIPVSVKRNKGGRPSTGRGKNAHGKQNASQDSKDTFTLGTVIQQLLGVAKTGDKASVRFTVDTSKEFAILINQCKDLKEQVKILLNLLF